MSKIAGINRKLLQNNNRHSLSEIALSNPRPERRRKRQGRDLQEGEQDPEITFQTVERWKDMVTSLGQEPQIIQDLFPDEKGGYGVIAGRTGIGKTNMILYLAHCLATGKPFFGLECQKVKVAVAAFEGDPHNLKGRLDKIKLSFPSTKDRLLFEVMPIQNPYQMLEDVTVKLKNTHGVKVVILDPIKYLVSGDYLSPKDVAPFIQIFREILTTLGMSAIVSLPISKPQDSKGVIRPANVYSIKGATEWVDSATFCILVEKKAYSNELVTMSYAKHRVASKELVDKELKFNQDKCIFESPINVDGAVISLR